MMRLLLLGVNHQSADVGLREKFALAGKQLDRAIERLRLRYPGTELVILSTCNRTELYLARPSHEPPTADDLRQFLAEFCHVDVKQLAAVSIHREHEQAMVHLFRVACGLESMVLGEPQILGQVKRAYEHAKGQHAVGATLHTVFQHAIATAKKLRHATGIDSGRMSVGSVAVDFARQIFERFDDKTVVGIGAGEAAKVTLRHLLQLEPARLWLTSRTTNRAMRLADSLGLSRSRGGVRAFEDLDQLLIDADIVLTSTSATEPIITVNRFEPLLRRRRFRPLFLIDIAVPRDVAPEVGALKNIYLYNIDNLQCVVAETHGQRTAQVHHCERMIHEAVRSTLTEIQNQDLGQLIRALRERLHKLGEMEQQRALRKLSSASADELNDLLPVVLQQLSQRLINKILHRPLTQLDRRNPDAPLEFYATALRRLFALDESSTASSNEPPSRAVQKPPKAISGIEVKIPKPADRSRRVTTT